MFKTKLNKFFGKTVKSITVGPDSTQIEFEDTNEYLYITNGKVLVLTVTSR